MPTYGLAGVSPESCGNCPAREQRDILGGAPTVGHRARGQHCTCWAPTRGAERALRVRTRSCVSRRRIDAIQYAADAARDIHVLH